MQQFVAYFENDYSGVTPVQSLALTVNNETAMPYTYIGDTPLRGNFKTYFKSSNLSDSTFSAPVKVDNKTMTATISVSIGFEEVADFKLNFASNLITTFATNCTNCADTPNFATNYLNLTGYESFGNYELSPTLDGYTLNTTAVKDYFCIENDGGKNDVYCSYIPIEIEAVTEIQYNSWNYDSPASAGILGVNINSPVFQDILYCGSSNYF